MKVILLALTNTLAFYVTELITAVKSFMIRTLECLLKCHLGCFTINNESSCHSVREKGEGAQRNSYSEAKGGFTPSMISAVNINFACDSYVFNQLQLEKMIENIRVAGKIDIHRENC